MPSRGLEPPLLAKPEPKSGASTNFATTAGLGEFTQPRIASVGEGSTFKLS